MLFQTAVYLINRLLTKILQNHCPFEVLNGKTPNYSELKIFGCSCYSLLRPYKLHKLAYESKCCVFLGYSNNKKGNCCLDLENNKVYSSCSVIFYETMDKDQTFLAPRSPSPIGNFYTLSNSVLLSNLLTNITYTESTPESTSLTLAATSIQIQNSEN